MVKTLFSVARKSQDICMYKYIFIYRKNICFQRGINPKIGGIYTTCGTTVSFVETLFSVSYKRVGIFYDTVYFQSPSMHSLCPFRSRGLE